MCLGIANAQTVPEIERIEEWTQGTEQSLNLSKSQPVAPINDLSSDSGGVNLSSNNLVTSPTVSNENKATTELYVCQTSKEGNSPKRGTFITPNPVAEANQEITIAAEQTFPPQNSAQNSLIKVQYVSCQSSDLSDVQVSKVSGQLAKIDSAKLYFSSQGELPDSLGKLLAHGDPGLSSEVFGREFKYPEN